MSLESTLIDNSENLKLVDTLKELISNHGLDRFIETLEYDDETDKLVNDWNSKKTSDIRKEYLRENEFSIFGI